LNGDSRIVLPQLADESVNCCVTSPPYYGLRDYGVAGQIGLEQTPDQYVAEMVGVMREVRRVLTKDGTLWLNIGDSYWTNTYLKGAPPRGYHVTGGEPHHEGKFAAKPAGIKSKDLLGIPWMLAFALRADGWYLRQDIIWSKPNPMPESVTDRCTKAHEYVFLLSKSPRYFYNADAIREEAAPWNSANGFNAEGQSRRNIEGRIGARDDVEQTGRNRRSVWSITTAPFPEAHFATFPPKLIEPCIRAGVPDGGSCIDPFGGAGTTGLVCQQQHVRCTLIELNPEYCGIIARRLSQSVLNFGAA
jgi:DNA modification methylase